MTVASKYWLGLLHDLPCVICVHCYGHGSKADHAHHIEFDRGEHSDFAAVPLCEQCHTLLHQMRRKSYYRMLKIDDLKLMAWTNELVAHEIRDKYRKVT